MAHTLADIERELDKKDRLKGCETSEDTQAIDLLGRLWAALPKALKLDEERHDIVLERGEALHDSSTQIGHHLTRSKAPNADPQYTFTVVLRIRRHRFFKSTTKWCLTCAPSPSTDGGTRRIMDWHLVIPHTDIRPLSISTHAEPSITRAAAEMAAVICDRGYDVAAGQ